MGGLEKIKEEMEKSANPSRAKASQRYFRTGKGEYGEGDIFMGIGGPEQRKMARKYHHELSLDDVQKLLDSNIHEHRQAGLFILVEKYRRAKKDNLVKRQIFDFYLKNTGRINNWDLVDCSAPHIIGDFAMIDGNFTIRFLAKSGNMWERRMAAVATYPLIKRGNFGETLFIADALMNDRHDLIHKAAGWMLREIGKRDMPVLELFLSARYKSMPRTMLRYAIEKFPEEKRRKYLKGEI
jgi:ribonuclease P protein component